MSLFRIINQEEARLANVTIGELLIRLILLEGPIGTKRVFAVVQLEAAGRMVTFGAFHLQLLDCVVIALLAFGLVEGLLQGIVVF